MPVALLRSSLLAATVGVGLGTLVLAPEAGAAFTDASAFELPPLATPKALTVTTKAGTPVPVWLFPSPKVSGQPASGQVVLVMFDCGDGVSIAPLVQLLQGLGATVVVFDNPLAGFDNPLAGFDNPLAGFDNPLAGFDNPLAGREKVEGDMGVATKTSEKPADVVHAMLTWATTGAIRDGQQHRVHLFGVGRGTELAVQVGAKRTGDLASILVDSPTTATTEMLTSLAGQGSLEVGYRGVHIVRAGKLPRALSQSTGSVSLAPNSISYRPATTLADIVVNANYQQAVAASFGG